MRLAAAAMIFAVALAPPAQARRRPRAKASGVRPEEDPSLKGDSKKFAKAAVAFTAPADGAVFDPAPAAVAVALRLEKYALRPPASAPTAATRLPQPYALLIVDNDVALRIDNEEPVQLHRLRAGPHSLRLVLSRPWGEVVKAPGAFALTRFWLGPRLEGKAGRAAELAVWPNPKRPILTYVFPLGDPRPDDPWLGAAPATTASQPAAVGVADAGGDAPADAATDSAAATVTDAVTAAVTDPASASAAAAGAAAAAVADAPAAKPAHAAATAVASTPAQRRPELDFFLSGATLRRRGRGDKLRVVVDKKELPLLREWKPSPLKLRPGPHRITIDLLDRRGTKVRNAVNRADRSFSVPE